MKQDELIKNLDDKIIELEKEESNKNSDEISTIIKNAEKMYEFVDKDLNDACRKYLIELENIKNQVSAIASDFSIKLLKMNKSNIAQGLKKEQISIDSLSLNKKNPDELISIFNALGHYSYLGTTLENTINGVIPSIINYLDMHTNENNVINYLYSNLYSTLSEDEIKDIFAKIKGRDLK